MTTRKISRIGLCACTALALVSCGSGILGTDEYLSNVTFQQPVLTDLPDGTYRGSYTIATPPDIWVGIRTIQVDVTVAGGAYSNIVIVDPPGLDENEYIQELKIAVMDGEPLGADAVSSATYASLAYLKAIEQAVAR